MTDSQLPQIRKAQEIQRKSRSLMMAGIIVGAFAVGSFVAHLPVLAIVLALVAVILGVSRALVEKSLQATADVGAKNSTSVDLKLEEVRKQLSKCKFLVNIEKEGQQASDLAHELIRQYQMLLSLLKSKLDPQEITFSRYLESIAATCLSLGENLLKLKLQLENLNSSWARLGEAERQSQKSEVQKEMKVIAEALGELTQLHQSLNQMNTKDAHRDQLEASLQQIREMAQRAQRYSKQ